MKKHTLTALLVFVAVTQSACGNLGYIVQTYDSSTIRSDFDYQGDTYRIFDRKDLSKVMITPSLGSSALNGVARGATLFAVNVDDDKTRFTDVAVAYLAKDRTPQICKILEGKLLVTPQWEFVYLCNDKQTK